MIISVVRTYHPENFEPTSVRHQDMKQINNFFEAYDIHLYKKYPTLNKTVSNVQPPQKLAPRVFPPLPHSKYFPLLPRSKYTTLHFLKKSFFQYFGLNDFDYIQIYEILVEKKNTVMLRIVVMSAEFLLRF